MSILDELTSIISYMDQTPAFPQMTTQQAPVVQVQSKYPVVLVSVLSFLVLSLVCFLAYSFFTDRLELPFNLGTTKEEKVPVVTENDDEKTLTNKGWALYSNPDFSFSAEIPSYTMDQRVGGDEEGNELETTSYWSVRSADMGEPKAFENYVESIMISFLPEHLNLFDCGEGCAKEHNITVEVFENTKDFNLEQAVDSFKQHVANNVVDGTVELENTQKWGVDTASYTLGAEAVSLKGYLVVREGNIFNITYNITESPVESAQIGQKVLDSFNFGN